MRVSVCAGSLLVFASYAGRAHGETAEEKRACLQTVERAQVARGEGRLRSARDGFVSCSRASCPSAIRDDCIRWVNEVEASLPTVACSAVGSDGRDVTRMTVTVDGQLLPGAESGRALAVDPGQHTFRFEAVGALPIEQRDVIREGEKNRVLRVIFTPAGPRAVLADPASMPRAAPGPAHVPVSAYVLGGVALASFATFAYLGLKGTGDLSSLRSSSCGEGGTCSPSAVSTARNEILAGDIIGLAGVAAAGVATWLFFDARGSRSAPAPVAVRWPAASPPWLAFTWQ